MTIDEASRRELWTSLRNTLGDAQADTLMTMLPSEPLPELATRADLDAAITTLRAEMRTEFAGLEAKFGELRGEFGEMRAEIARQMLTLGLTLGSLVVAVLGTILTLGFTGAFA